MIIKNIRTTVILSLICFGASFQQASAQEVNNALARNAIIDSITQITAPEDATANDIAVAARTLVFSMEGDLEENLTQVMVSLEELTQEGRFRNAPLKGDNNPSGRLYLSILNAASSNYYDLTVQDIIRLTAAMRDARNFVNGAESNAITRK